MTSQEMEDRIFRLEILVERLADALLRKDTERDGNWGYPPFHEEMGHIVHAAQAYRGGPFKAITYDEARAALAEGKTP